MKTFVIILCTFIASLSYAGDFSLKAISGNILEGKIFSPEGVAVSPFGDIFVSSLKTGKIFRINKEGSKEIIDLGNLNGWKKSSRPRVLGILAESNSQLWVALTNVWGGCIYSVTIKSQGNVAKPAFCQAGEVNAMILDKNGTKVFISSKVSGITTSGMIISVGLNDLKAAVKNGFINYDPAKHLFAEVDAPNGLAFSRGGTLLLFAQTMDDKVSAIDLATKEVHTVFETDESGWLDGLAYINEKDLFVVTDSKLGKLHFFKLKGDKVRTITVTDPAGKSTGLASVAILGDRLYVTDMWEGDLFNLVYDDITGSQDTIYHSNVYQFSLSRLLKN